MAVQLPWTSDVPFLNAYLIEAWYRRSQRFFGRDRRTYTLRFEDLVRFPEPTLQALCDFLQEPYEATMLSTEAAAKVTAPTHEPWKQQVGQTLDPGRCLGWQNYPPTLELEAISSICQTLIRDFNYTPLASKLQPIWAHYTTDRFVRSQQQTLQQLLHKGYLLVPCEPLQLPAGACLLYGDIPFSSPMLMKSWQQFLEFCLTLGILRWQGTTIRFSHFCQSPVPERNLWGKTAAVLLRGLGSPMQRDYRSDVGTL
jgi:hypothetical protein